MAQGLRALAQRAPVVPGNPALSGEEQHGSIMEPATLAPTKRLAAGLRKMAEHLGNGRSILDEMAQHSDAQKSRLASGDFKPTAPTGASMDIASGFAGGGMAGIIKSIPAPAWNRAAKSLEVAINPTMRELRELFRDEDTLRVLKSGADAYFWPASRALHDDIGAAFKLDPSKTTHGLIGKEQLRAPQ